MKLAAIYNVWDGVELLEGSIDCIAKDVDVIIIVWQRVSNFGGFFDPFPAIEKIVSKYPTKAFGLSKYIPEQNKGGAYNEKKKRNIGLDLAKFSGCTHFLHLDCDEYYEDFAAAKKQYIDSQIPGSVCKIITYFNKPTYQLDGLDNYYVPFIHELKADTVAGERNYPFYVDPTRRINEKYVICLATVMHHFSYVRENIMRKVNNSSAKANIERMDLMADYFIVEEMANPEGYFVKDFDKKIKIVENKFNISVC